MHSKLRSALVLSMVAIGLSSSATWAGRESDIRNTKHNLGTSSPGSTKASSEDAICVFCHTPHGANSQTGAPLWNKNLSGQTYTPYSSGSIDAIDVGQPDGKSKLCLSCHDGTLAIGAVVNMRGSGPGSGPVGMVGAAGDGSMPAGSGTNSGFTRDLGVDLSNDHPVSFTYNDATAVKDGELRLPSNESHIGNQSSGVKPTFPLENSTAANQMQCTTCHDPHIKGVDAPTGTSVSEANNIKFLRAPRFQMSNPDGLGFNDGTYNSNGDATAGDILCLGCHDRDIGGRVWADSVHANETDANEVYTSSAAAQREFPANIKVWQVACLNCHDTHSVQGSRRLLREGTNSTAFPKTGGNAATEETCYQCHTDSGQTILQSNSSVPDIETEFGRAFHMPITNNGSPTYGKQTAATEQHDIGFVDDWPLSGEFPSKPTVAVGANFVEQPKNLGLNDLDNRHAECTDCHNPHRIVKNTRYDGTGSSTKATHDHDPSGDYLNHNAAPGALKGAFGVEIQSWSNTAFGSLPTQIELRCGVEGNVLDPNNPASDTGGCDDTGEVTKEYQVCLKCHSNFAYDDTGAPEGGFTGRPDTDGSTNTLNSATSRSRYVLQNYTNQAMEFQAPTAHMGETTSMTGSGASTRYDNTSNSNHRSWHPVMKKTGRTLSVRQMKGNKNTWSAPWQTGLGNQTMMCSDCHNNGSNGKAEGGSSAVGGPHGSSNFRILRDPWNDEARRGGTGNTEPFCKDCHGNGPYFTGDKESGSGWKHTHENNAIKCTWCHIAIPHGWKNKSFLVNLNDVGPEVSCDSTYTYSPACTVGQPIPVGTEVWRIGSSKISSSATQRYYNPPYYNGSILKVMKFKNGWNQWDNESNCGSQNSSSDRGEDWMDGVKCGS